MDKPLEEMTLQERYQHATWPKSQDDPTPPVSSASEDEPLGAVPETAPEPEPEHVPTAKELRAEERAEEKREEAAERKAEDKAEAKRHRKGK